MRRLFLGLSLAAVAAASAFGLSACSLVPHADQVKAVVDTAIDTGIEDRKAFNDKKASTLLALPCDISIGAYYRMENAVQQEALTMLCSGKRPGEAPPPLVATGSALAPLEGLGESPPAAP